MEFKRRPLLSKIDLFGTSPNLNINKQSKYTTQCGGVLTLFIAIMTILVIINSSMDLIQRQNPNVSLSEKVLDSVGRVTPGHDKDMNFAITLLNFATLQGYIDTTIYTARAYIFQTPPNRGDPLLVYDLDVEVCTQESAGILQNAVGSAWCIKTNTKNKNKIEIGHFEDSTLVFALDPCQNGQGVTCKDSTNITNTLKSSLIGVHYTYVAMDPENRENPMTLRPDLYLAGGLGFGSSLSVRMTLKELELKSEQSFFLTKSDKQSKPAVQSINVEQNTPRNNEFLAMYFNLGTRKTVYNRRYKSIEDVIAEVSGIMQGILLIVTVVFTPYLEKKYYLSMINSIFEIEYKKNHDQQSKGITYLHSDSRRSQKRDSYIQGSKASTIQQAYSLDQNNNQNQFKERKNSKPFQEESESKENDQEKGEIKDPRIVQQDQINAQKSNLTESDMSQNLNEIRDQEIYNPDSKYQMKIKSKFDVLMPYRESNEGGTSKKVNKQRGNKEKIATKIRFSFWEWIKLSIFCNKKVKKKEKVLNVGTQLLESQLNVYYLMNKLQEIDKIKQCLFSEEQKLLFENLAKPKLKLNEIGKQNMSERESIGQSQSSQNVFMTNEEQYQKIQVTYSKNLKQLSEKENKSQIELKLLEMIQKG